MFNSDFSSNSLEKELQIADRELYDSKGFYLTDLQKMVLKGAIDNQTYEEIAEQAGYSDKYLKRDVGPKLWKLLSEALGERVSKKNFRSALERKLWESNFTPSRKTDLSNVHQHWGEADDIPVFYGRTQELATLGQWIVNDRCRLVAVLGTRGIGKTALSIKLAQQIQDEFEYIIWRSLSQAPLKELLADLIRFLSNQETALAEDSSTKISQLLDLLRQHRCLLILDGAESLLRSGNSSGQYKPQDREYAQLLKHIGGVEHQSCLVLTSREKPKHLTLQEGENFPIRSFHLKGLKEEGQHILKINGLSGSEEEYRQLIALYRGNPLWLKMVTKTIQNLFDSNLSKFLVAEMVVFREIGDFLRQDFNRLSRQEQEIMYWLTINREPVSIQDLREDIVPRIQLSELAEALESLRCRSMIEINRDKFALQPVVREYITDRLINQVCEEITTGNLSLFKSHSLIKAQAKAYIRETQVRQILKPLINKLLTIYGSKKNLINHLCCILETLREQFLGQLQETGSLATLLNQQVLEQAEESSGQGDNLVCRLIFFLSSYESFNSSHDFSSRLQERSLLPSGYAGGNILNLLCQLETDLSNYNFSELNIWQAYLQDVSLHHVNFAHSNLAKSVFTNSFSNIISLGFSLGDRVLSAVNNNGEIYRWQVADVRQVSHTKSSGKWVCAAACSLDGQVFASASDRAICLLDASTGQVLKTLSEPSEGTEQIASVTFSPDGQVLASGSNDGVVKLWSVVTGQVLKTLSEPSEETEQIASVTFSPDGQVLASGSSDGVVKLWSVVTGQVLKTLYEHAERVSCITFSPDGQLLASGSSDETIKLWHTSRNQLLTTLRGHAGEIQLVTFSADGKTIASSSNDSSIMLWSSKSGRCLRVLQGYDNSAVSCALSSDSKLLAGGSNDKTVKVWNTITGSCKSLTGHSRGVRSVSFSFDSQLLASGSNDRTIKLWLVGTGQCLKTLYGHTSQITSVAFAPSNRTLASGSNDRSVKLWNIATGECLKSFAHASQICAVAFSSDGQVLASGSDNGTVELWDIATGKCFNSLQGHSGKIKSLAFSRDNQLLASSDGRTGKLWNIQTRQCLNSVNRFHKTVYAVAFSGDSQLLATRTTDSKDCNLMLWDLKSQNLTAEDGHEQAPLLQGSEPVTLLEGHTDLIETVTFSSDSQTLASSSRDGTIKLWDIKTSQCIKSFFINKPYKGMNITEVTLTGVLESSLKALGAINYSPD
ncbi:PQQ-binding-like beta-propeller repeat protein [Pleurocapsales cyanobacterium LEGE 10410]|nr:PQQ-binding-like beta-propeller repeat protein [Pleurocapsales cyanobacterium LEGE 10410]